MKAALRRLAYSAALAAAKGVRPRNRQTFKLGVLKVDRLGDAVLALGSVRRLIQGVGAENTLLVTSTLGADLYRAEVPDAEVIALPPFVNEFFPGYLSFLRREAALLGSFQVERLVCLRHQPSDYLHTVAGLLSPKACYASRSTLPSENTSLAYPEVVHVPYPVESQGQCLELEAHRRVVEAALGCPVDAEEVIPALQSVRPAEGDFLLICPIAGDALRMYPPHLLAEAVRRILQRNELPVEICLPPGAEEAAWLEAMTAAAVICRQVHRPADSLRLAEVVARARAVLSCDSAPAHLAIALDKPGVFLLGGGHFGHFAPWSKSFRQKWLFQPMDCYHCQWKCRYSEPYCITHIAPDRIASALADLLPS